MTDRSWQVIEQTVKYGQMTEDKVEHAMETMVSSAIRLIQEGRIANPLNVTEMLAGPEGAQQA